MSKILTSKEYVKKRFKAGDVCPVCQSDNVCSSKLDAMHDYATCRVECSDCGSYWIDFYQLIRYDFLYDAIEEEEVLE